MIILRRKEYSTRLTKSLYALNKAADGFKTVMAQQGQYLRTSITGKRPMPTQEFVRKSDTALKRAAINQRDGLKRAAFRISTDPGGEAGKFIGTQFVRPAIHSPGTTILSQLPITPPGTGTMLVNSAAGQKILRHGPEARLLDKIPGLEKRHDWADKKVIPGMQNLGRATLDGLRTVFV